MFGGRGGIVYVISRPLCPEDQAFSELSCSGFKVYSAVITRDKTTKTKRTKPLRNHLSIFRLIPEKVTPNPNSLLLLRVPNTVL